MQEVFAGFVEHVDAQIGKMLDALETLDQRENTLIIYIVGDNGASAEGSLTGTLNNMNRSMAIRTTPPRCSPTGSTRSAVPVMRTITLCRGAGRARRR